MSRDTDSNPPLPQASAWREAMTDLGRDPAWIDALMKETEHRYHELLAGRPRHGDAAIRNHMEGNILPALALYQTLRVDHDEDTALHLIERALQQPIRRNRRFLEFLGKLPFFFSLLRKFAYPLTTRGFPPEGWETEWVEVSRDLVALNMHRCIYLDTVTEYGAPELAPVFCRLDDAIYDEVSPYMLWDRSTTLALGGEYCDFRFRRRRRRDAGR